MVLMIILVVMGALAVLSVLIALKLLLKSGWFLGWVKGSVGLFLLGLALILGFLVFQLRTFDVQTKDLSLGTVSVSQVSDHEFSLSISVAKQASISYPVEGDFWTTSYRIVDFKGLPGGQNLPIVFQLEGVSGRYMTLEQELKAQVSPPVIDAMSDRIWPIMQLFDSLGIIDAYIGELEFVPLVDGALFDVQLSAAEMNLQPLNEPAESALQP